jgi:Fur family ferric uptake transcriptional regulator
MRTSLNNANATKASSYLEGALDRFRELLRGQSLRMTDVREAILRAALSRKGHFDIEELTEDVQHQGVDASRATVYRALPLLIEAGIIQPTVLSGNRRRYEAAYKKKHHDHLICSRCSKVVEFHFEAFEMLQRDLAAKYNFQLTAHFHELIGICGDCQAKEKYAH